MILRLKQNSDPESTRHQPSGPLALRNIRLDKFMWYFDQWAIWGWILYPDGSITYFDGQCGCCWPKDGLYCHDGQYEAGKPEVMAKEQKAATGKPRAEQPGRPAQPATKPADKPPVKDQPTTPTSKASPR